jgi:hypothetical protein
MYRTSRRRHAALAANWLTAALALGVVALAAMLTAAAPMLLVGYGVTAASATLAYTSLGGAVAMLAALAASGLCLVGHAHHNRAAAKRHA